MAIAKCTIATFDISTLFIYYKYTRTTRLKSTTHQTVLMTSEFNLKNKLWLINHPLIKAVEIEKVQEMTNCAKKAKTAWWIYLCEER